MNERPYHRAVGINNRGSVTALCFRSPRAINLKVATWTNRDEAVTCPKCLALLHEYRASKGKTDRLTTKENNNG